MGRAAGTIDTYRSFACAIVVTNVPEGSPLRAVAGLLLLLVFPGIAVSRLIMPEVRLSAGWGAPVIYVTVSLVITCALALLIRLLGMPLSSPALPLAVAGTSIAATVASALNRTSEERPASEWGAFSAVGFLLAATIVAIWIGRTGAPMPLQPFTVFSVTGAAGTAESLMDNRDCSGLHVVLTVESQETSERSYELWESSPVSTQLIRTIPLAPGEREQIPVTLPDLHGTSGAVTFELRSPPDVVYRSLSICRDT